MANEWFRLWHDMANDPKWKTIARVSGQPISVVLAVALHYMTDASRNVTRGHVSVTHEDVASALDVTDEAIAAIHAAMQGRVMDGDKLSGWEKRQPKREDQGDEKSGAKSAAQRKREQREREKQGSDSEQSDHGHAESRDVTLDKDKEEDKEEKHNPANAGLPGIEDSPPAAGPRLVPPVCPHQEIIALYHDKLPTGTRVRVWNETRMKHLQARWREDANRQNLDWWGRFFDYCAQSEFLTGQTPAAPGRDPFVVSLDWLVAPQNFAKTVEGKYNRSAA